MKCKKFNLQVGPGGYCSNCGRQRSTHKVKKISLHTNRIKNIDHKEQFNIGEKDMESWDEFYKWLESKGYNIYRRSNIFRGDKFITDFDPIEDDDSGEIEETIKRIKERDVFNFS